MQNVRLRQYALIAAPLLLLASTWAAFQLATAWLGPRTGYFAGFLFYWLVWCLGLPLAVLGRDIRTAFRNVARPLGDRPWLAAVALVGPLVLGFGYAFPAALGHATPLILVTSAVLAIVNAAAEELLWRATYLKTFPDSPFLGCVYPTFGFAIWHFAPQSVFPSAAPGGAVSLVLVAGLIGLGWSYVARVTGTNRWTTLSHILFDFSGLGTRIYFG